MSMRNAVRRALLAASAACTLAAWGAPVDARAAVSASTDFGSHHRAPSQAHRVILVNETRTGAWALEARRVDDDAVVAFAGSRPAWRLDIPLSCYFLTPVYMRDPGGWIPGDRSV